MFLNYISKQPYLDASDDFGGGSEDFEDVQIQSDSFEETETDTEGQQIDSEVEISTEDTKPVETATEQPKIKVKYNHEEMEYSTDDAVPLIQKGLNYDKLQEKFTELQGNPALTKFNKIQEVSTLLGYQSEDEMIEALFTTAHQNKADELGYTVDQIRKDYELTQRETAVKNQREAEEKKTKETKMYADFVQNFPGVTTEMINSETWARFDTGMDLSSAYVMQQNKELQDKVKALEQNSKNEKKAPISGVTQNGSDTTKVDKFLVGFDD